MRYTDNAINIITLKNYIKGIGRAWINKYLKGNENVETIVSLLNKYSKQEKLVTIEDFEFFKGEIIKKIDKLGESCDGIVAIGDKHFPKHRGTVKDSEKPIYLFYKGDINLLNLESNNIAVIGLLDPDKEIEKRERKLVSEIIKRGFVIVSGLALGCDSIAHDEALKGGKTIAILPSPLNNILPARNKKLAFDIVENGGLLITEYFDEHKSPMDLNTRYRERDRLQALYSDAIILVASYAQDSAQRWKISDKKLDSGARLAMGFAKEYEIPRAVMYDTNIDNINPMFDLNRQIINEGNGTIVLTQKNLEELIKKIILKKNINSVIQLKLIDT